METYDVLYSIEKLIAADDALLVYLFDGYSPDVIRTVLNNYHSSGEVVIKSSDESVFEKLNALSIHIDD